MENQIEIWKVIDGYEGRYQVSNFARVKRVFKSTTTYSKGNDNIGYVRVTFCINAISYRKLLHRVVAEAFIPNPENKPYVNHIDGNKLNNNLSNLEWVTASENSQHSYDIGMRTSNEYKKFTPRNVLGILEHSKIGFSNAEIAIIYATTSSTVSLIKNGKTHKRLLKTQDLTPYKNF